MMKLFLMMMIKLLLLMMMMMMMIMIHDAVSFRPTRWELTRIDARSYDCS